MDSEIPAELRVTYTMLKGAFPNGLTEKEYYSVLNYLYENMSDHQLALVISLVLVRKKCFEVLNDIYKTVNLASNVKTDRATYDKLISNGYEKWLKEE